MQYPDTRRERALDAIAGLFLAAVMFAAICVASLAGAAS